MKYKLSQKAYKVDFSKIEEGFLYSESVCYAENRNKAKTILLQMNKYENVCLKGTDEEVNYLTIPVIRCKQADKYFFEDKELTINKIEEILNERVRLNEFDKILNDDSITHCYIRKGSYYCSNWSGYTDIKSNAGVYSKKEAVSHAKGVSSITLISIDKEEHNKMINDKINELKSKLI